MIEELKKYLKETSIEQLLKDWEEVKGVGTGIDAITANEFCNEINSENVDLANIRLSSLVDDWLDRQIEYEKIASEKEDARHAAKFNGKSQATRDCWKELQRLIKDEA